MGRQLVARGAAGADCCLGVARISSCTLWLNTENSRDKNFVIFISPLQTFAGEPLNLRNAIKAESLESRLSVSRDDWIRTSDHTPPPDVPSY